MKLRRWFTLLMIAMLPIMAMAQSGTVYPIDLSVMMTPPYGPCLKEYVGSDRINIQALLKDFTKNSDQFVVELKVTDNRNRVVLLTHFGDYDFPAGKTFTYPMGPNSTSAQKSNVLHDLFNNAKIKPKDECFEEGAYTFVFQAFDAHSYGSRKVALSMPFTYPVFLQGNTVQPLQIYPYEHEVICNHAFEYTAKNGIKKIATQLGGIAYQWQSANPTGMRVGYHVQVVDLGEIAGRTKENIESAAQSSFGITDKYILDRRTYTPFCNHDFTAANYVEDHAYAWRVMAVTGDALDKEASFTDKNAPVRVFYFCGAPGIEKDDYVVVKDERKFDKDLAKVKMDTIKSTDLNALALWRDSSVKDAYCGVNVEIRKKGQDKWTPYFVEKTADFVAGKEPTDNNFNFENLSYNTHYEVRAQYVKCDNCSDRTENCVYAPYSDIMEFVIDQPIDSAVCGDNLPKLADCGEGSEIPKVVAGDIIIANGTEVVVDSVSYPNASDSSIISGTAHLCMPMIKNIQLKMEFEEIQINCAKELVMGRIKSVWDETTCAMIDLDEAGGQNSTGGKDNPSSDATVEPYDPATASSKPSGTLMVDGNKNVMFRTDKDGEVVTIGKFVSFTSSEYQSTNYLADNTHYVEFYNDDKVNNAFDNDQQGYYRNITNEYEYFDTPHTNVVLPWLANNPGKQKIIKAREVKKKSTSASFESVLFVIPCESGYIQLETTKDANGNYELNIPGLADVASSTPIYAIARTSDETPYFDAGKMMQANYAERTHKLIIVPTKEEYSADIAKIQEQLNAIYGRVGVTYTVEEDRSFTNDEYVNAILKDGLDVSADDESRWQVESSEMKFLRDIYESSHPDMDKKAAYLFLVNQAESPYESTEGDMPRNQSVGYIFMKNNKKLEDGRVVAHELGHGVYKFQHTFDYKIPEKSTDNLMDYNNGDFLAHYQWRVMQDSVMFVWKGLQDDEDGMLMLFLTDEEILSRFVKKIHETNFDNRTLANGSPANRELARNAKFEFDCLKMLKKCTRNLSDMYTNNTFTMADANMCNVIIGKKVYVNSNYYHIRLETSPQNKFNSIPKDTIFWEPSINIPSIKAPNAKKIAMKYRNCAFLDSVTYVFADYKLTIRGKDSWKVGRYMFGPFLEDGTIKGDPFPNMKVTVDGNKVKGYWGCTRYTTSNPNCPGTTIRSHYTQFPGKNKSHDGIDLTATVGTDIHAVRSGIVVGVVTRFHPRNDEYETQNNKNWNGKSGTGANCGCDYESGSNGNVVIIRTKEKVTKYDSTEANQFYVMYAHLNTVSVAVNDSITEGDIIGKTGCSGNAGSYTLSQQQYLHLHIESSTNQPTNNTSFYNKKRDINPLDLFSTKIQTP